jgi:biopolymer transport protein TolR
MGMSVGAKQGAVRNDINVTPLVDVVLVLLIIFLVTMPVVMRTESLEVPRKAEDFEDVTTVSKQIIVTYTADNKVVLSDGLDDDKNRRIEAANLAVELRPMLEQKQGEKIVFVDFCEHVRWSDVIQTMDQVRSLAQDKDHNDIKVALKKKEKKSDLAADPSRKDPCAE